MRASQVLLLVLSVAGAGWAQNPVVALYPRSITVQTGSTKQFIGIAIIVPKDSNNAVTWHVNGVPGGNPTFGTIDATGKYTAPSTVPSPPDVTVKAVSSYDNSASNTASVHIAPKITLNHYSYYLYPGETILLRAKVTGVVTPLGVTWAVNGISGGNATLGTIDSSGNYTAPAKVPAPGWVWITATSSADPKAVAYGYIKLYQPKMMQIHPSNVSVLPNGGVHFYRYTNLYHPVSSPSYHPLTQWKVDNIVGGNASVGTIDVSGAYTAPATPGTHIITAVNQVDKRYAARATVRVTSNAGASGVGWLAPYYRPRPYDVYAPMDSITLYAARGQYVGAHILLTANGEDISAADITSSGLAGTTNTVSLEGMINSIVPSNNQPLGEYPDPLFPKVDVLFKQRRKVQWPDAGIRINRISPGYIRPWYADNAGKMTAYATATQLTNQTLDCSVNSASRTANVVTLKFKSCAADREVVPHVSQEITVSGVAAGMGGTSFNGRFTICGPPSRGCINPTASAISYQQTAADDSSRGPDGAVTALRGYGWMTTAGGYTGSTLKRYYIRMDGTGMRSTATFRWSTDGGSTWKGAGIPASRCPCDLEEGVAVDFAEDITNFPGMPSFNAGDGFEFWAGPFRNQPVWIDFHVPRTQAPGTYQGTVGVRWTGSASGVHTTNLKVTLVVLNLTVPLSPSIKSQIGSVQATDLNFSITGVRGSQDEKLPNAESAIFLLNRLGTPVFDCQYDPNYKFNANATAITASDYTNLDRCRLPALSGRAAINGEKANAVANSQQYFKVPPMTTPTKHYLSIKDEMKHYHGLGYYGVMFDYTKDEPSTPSDITIALQHSALARAAAAANSYPDYKTLVTSDLSTSTDWIGHITRIVPIQDVLDPQLGFGSVNDAYANSRGQHQVFKDMGAELWFYDSCQELGCGGPGEGDNTYGYPVQGALDEEGTFPFLLGIEGAILGADGYLYYASDAAAFYVGMPQPRMDYFTASYWFSSNGGGGMAYPGRTSCTISPNCVSIGGTTPTVLESLRMKHVRDGFYLWEIINMCPDRAACLGPILTQYQDGHTWNPDPSVWSAVVQKVMEIADAQLKGAAK